MYVCMTKPNEQWVRTILNFNTKNMHENIRWCNSTLDEFSMISSIKRLTCQLMNWTIYWQILENNPSKFRFVIGWVYFIWFVQILICTVLKEMKIKCSSRHEFQSGGKNAMVPLKVFIYTVPQSLS